MSYSDQFSDEYIADADTEIDVDEFKLKQNPIDAFIENKRPKNDQKTIDRKIRSLREYEAFLYHELDEHVCNASESDIAKFNQHLKGERDRDRYYHITDWRGQKSDELGELKECGEAHRHTMLVRIRAFYSWLDDMGIVSVNPVKTFLENVPDEEFDLTPPDRRRIELHEMREFLDWIDEPLARCVVLTFLKTGIRLGELLNIDLSCLHLGGVDGGTHPLYQSILDRHDVELQSDIKQKPDTLYIYSKADLKNKNRRRSNKRKKQEGTVIPLDSELKTALFEYLLARRFPKMDMEDVPLFTSTSAGTFVRLTKSALYTLITSNNTGADDGVLGRYGWYKPGADTEDNVTVHYLRHYFSDNHKHNHGVHHEWMPIGVISYIRGDTDESVMAEGIESQSSALMENYSHSDWRNWKRNIRDPYLDSIYRFNVYDEVIPALGDKQ